MNETNVQTLLRFAGEWPPLQAFGLAFLLAVGMFFFYRRELGYHHRTARWVLPSLRALAVFLITLCLAGPVLRHVSTYRQLGRVVIVADASASMSFNDVLTTNPSGQTSNTEPSRYERAGEALLGPSLSLVKKISENHDVELFSLQGYRAQRFWWRREQGRDSNGPLPGALPGKPEATTSNLDQPLRDALGPSPAGSALVLLSDGQHNAPGSPEILAASLKEGGIPVFTIGYGSEGAPSDLALLDVSAPEAVFAGDRTEGVLTVQDTLPAGLQARAVISSQGRTIWQHPFTTNGAGERRLEFSFPVQEIPAPADARQSMRLLNFRVELTGRQSIQDQILANNQRSLSLHLLTRKRRVLLLDGRARWETRYLNNHLTRDERWEVVSAFDDLDAGDSGTVQKAFPKDKDALMQFDLVILGDLRPEVLKAEQHDLLREFVEKRGGGLILLDGQRGHLQKWSQTRASVLLPVSWSPQRPTAQASMTYGLTEQGQGLEALRLSDSAGANAELWNKLPATRWAAHATPLAGASAIGEVFAPDQTSTAAMVWRRVGAGSVLWLGTDELWRWRFEVGDLHHQRFWMQISSWIAAPPFLVEDNRVSMGSDRLRYQEGDTAELRVKLRDESGNVPEEVNARAHVFRNGLEIASLQLEPDPAHGGVFRAITGALPAGDYHVSVSEDRKAPSDLKLSFRVENQVNQEWAQLTLNRALLEGMARASGGRFLRESDIGQLPGLLQQLDRKETRVTETLLWSSWWWFGAAMVLLTTEWLLRKHWRLV